jgi:hypothetical protein
MGVLSLGVQAGSHIAITTCPDMLVVTDIIDNGLQGKFELGSQTFVVSDEERVEVWPEVFVFCGISKGMDWHLKNKSKLAFEAPLDIRINRAGVYA